MRCMPCICGGINEIQAVYMWRDKRDVGCVGICGGGVLMRCRQCMYIWGVY